MEIPLRSAQQLYTAIARDDRTALLLISIPQGDNAARQSPLRARLTGDEGVAKPSPLPVLLLTDPKR
jgi:hypothetical protein